MAPASASDLYDNKSLSTAQMRTVETALHTLAIHLPEVNSLLDTSFSNISEQFVEVADLMARYDKLSQNTAPSAEENATRAKIFTRMSTLVSKTIIDMQFQDRVSQNLVITINISRQIADFLSAQLTHGTPLDTKLTQQFVHLLNLGDIKQKFIAHAQATGAMEDPAEYGIRDAHVEAKAADEDDIELF